MRWVDLRKIAEASRPRAKVSKSAGKRKKQSDKSAEDLWIISAVPPDAETIRFHYDLTVIPRSSDRASVSVDYVRNPTTTPPKDAIAQTRRLGGFEKTLPQFLALTGPPDEAEGHAAASFTFPDDAWELSLRLPSLDELHFVPPAGKMTTRPSGIQLSFGTGPRRGAMRVYLPLEDASTPGPEGRGISVVVNLLAVGVTEGLANLDKIYDDLRDWAERCVRKKH